MSVERQYGFRPKVFEDFDCRESTKFVDVNCGGVLDGEQAVRIRPSARRGLSEKGISQAVGGPGGDTCMG